MGERQLQDGIAHVAKRAGLGAVSDLVRLTGGATMESWRFSAGGEDYVLRRAPSAQMMETRPFGHDTEAAIIRAVHAAGVTAPEIVAELHEDDGIGTGFVMRALPGTPDPRAILAVDDPDALLVRCGQELARIHALSRDALPDAVPTLDLRESIADFRVRFAASGGDRPIIALGLRWLEDNAPAPAPTVLNHGDFRVGNLLVQDGALTGVLDWELAHFGDPHEDLAFGCMAVWRFARYDRPALGLGSLDTYFAAYEDAGGTPVDPVRFRYWMIYRTVWWALGCLGMGNIWREGADRTLERAVISRRTSEQELDLLLLLEEEAPAEERARTLDATARKPGDTGEATSGDLATAIAEWLATIKDRMEGHDRFQLAVARNALGIIARNQGIQPDDCSRGLADDLLEGRQTLAAPGLLARLRRAALAKLAADMPKYPALAVARSKWTGGD